MEEKEFCLFMNTLARDVTKHFDGNNGNAFENCYIVDGIYYFVTIRENVYTTGYKLEIYGNMVDDATYKYTLPFVFESEYISSLFVELPKFIYEIIRVLYSM